MNIKELKPDYDQALADMIRVNLKKHSLDIPGTVYFDDNLNHLSDFYRYLVITFKTQTIEKEVPRAFLSGDEGSISSYC